MSNLFIKNHINLKYGLDLQIDDIHHLNRIFRQNYEVLKDDREPITVAEIVAYCNENGLISKSRKQNLVYQRHYLCYWLKNQELTLDFIGQMIQKDHSTVINGIKMTKNLYEDTYFRFITQEIRLFLKGKFLVK